MNSRTLTCAIKFTQEAADQYTEIRYIAGELERPVAAKPVIVKTPQEILEDEVISDYATLSGDKMRAKMNANRAYRDTYNRLAETNRLESRVTQLHDGARL